MSITNIQSSPNTTISVECGSELDVFLKRMLMAFNQLMFEDIVKLFDAFVAYREGRDYEVPYSKIKVDNWAEEKAFKMENESI